MKKCFVILFTGFFLANYLNAFTKEQEIIRAAVLAELIKIQRGVEVGDIDSAFVFDSIKQFCEGNRYSITSLAELTLLRDQKTTCEVLSEMLALAQK